MRIGIDARLFGSKQGGLGRYVEQLILHLEELNPEAEFVIFLRRENWDEFNPRNSRFTKVLADVKWYGFEEQTKFLNILKQHPVDLMHFPHWNVPLLYNRPFVVTIHDLLLLHFPTRKASTLGPIIYFIKHLGYKLVLSHAAKRAKKVITVSNFTKIDIVKNLKVPESKIEVTKPAPTPSDPKIAEGKVAHFGISKPYVLYVGSAFPHKNLDRTLEAWERFCSRNGGEYQLVLCGPKNYFYDQLINKFAQLFSEKKVIYTGFVPDNELPSLYEGASLFIFPTLYEGFGIPPLEAMKHKIPVIASNASCIPEILEGAALYFDPKNIDEITAVIETGLKDEFLRAELLNLGQKMAQKYDWKLLAKSSWEIYQNVV